LALAEGYMIENLLTKDEAKILQAANASEGSYLYELASAAALTPADVLTAAERLNGRGYVVLDEEKRFVKLTRQGREVRQDISESSLEDPNLKLGRSYVVATDEAAEDSSYDEMSETDVSDAIDAEISKYE
jgi:DNA-binding MarR family transcriptional regulator